LQRGQIKAARKAALGGFHSKAIVAGDGVW
jgi:hypothetical protein